MTSFADAALAATARMRGLFPPTPCARNDYLSQKFGAEIWLKREDLSPVRSYKIRGAFNAMRKVRASNPDQNQFICASAGNHAQGVAFACRHFGVRHHLHAGDHAATEDHEDACVRGRCDRDPPDGGLF